MNDDEDILGKMSNMLSKKNDDKVNSTSENESCSDNEYKLKLNKNDESSKNILPSFLMKDNSEDNSDNSSNNQNKYLDFEDEGSDDEPGNTQGNLGYDNVYSMNQNNMANNNLMSSKNKKPLKPPTGQKFFSFDDNTMRAFQFSNNNHNINNNANYVNSNMNFQNNNNNNNNMKNLSSFSNINCMNSMNNLSCFSNMNNMNGLNNINNINNNINSSNINCMRNNNAYSNDNNISNPNNNYHMQNYLNNNNNNSNNMNINRLNVMQTRCSDNFNMNKSPQIFSNYRINNNSGNYSGNFNQYLAKYIQNNNNSNPPNPSPQSFDPYQNWNVNNNNNNPDSYPQNYDISVSGGMNSMNNSINIQSPNLGPPIHRLNSFSIANSNNVYNGLMNQYGNEFLSNNDNNNLMNNNNMNNFVPILTNPNRIQSQHFMNNNYKLNNFNINQNINQVEINVCPNNNDYDNMNKMYTSNSMNMSHLTNSNNITNLNNIQISSGKGNNNDIKSTNSSNMNTMNNNSSLNNLNNTSAKKSKKKAKKSSTESEFLNINSLINLEDYDLFQYIITQKGSRDVQNILKKVSENNVETLLQKLNPYLSDIMIDKYGNYFSQRLIQICSPNQRVLLLKSIKNRFVEISKNSFGTHPLQSLIEIVNMPNEKEILLECIENNELELSLDGKGTHVLQKFINCSTEEERGNVDQNIIKILPKIINDSFGVCVLIKLIKHTNNQKIKEIIANYISQNNPLNFIQNPYANYAIQSLFNPVDIHLCKDIIKCIVDHFFSLSMQKFSSNVVENCIRYSDESVVKLIYNDIISTGKLGSMLNNTYGNFVIEKLIARLNKEEKNEMIKEINKLGKEKTLSNSITNLLFK